MTALTDRIAEVLRKHRLTGAMYCACHCGFSSTTGVGRSFYEQYADHVAERIEAELQLTEERTQIRHGRAHGFGPDEYEVRWVTPPVRVEVKR